MRNMMVTRSPAHDRLFRALGDPVRLEIVETLAEGPLAVRPLAARFAVSRPAVSRHLRVLSDAGLVTSERVGRENVYRLEPTPFREAEAWLRSLWRGRLGALKRLVEGASE